MLKVAALSLGVALSASAAHAYPQSVRKACAGDYQNFCKQYAPESQQARRCFEQNRRALTPRCVSALVDAGEVPKKYLRKR